MRTGCEAGRGRGGRTTGGAWDNRADTPKGLLLNQIERNSKLVVALVVWLLTPSSPISGLSAVSLVQYNVVSTDGVPKIVFYILTPLAFQT